MYSKQIDRIKSILDECGVICKKEMTKNQIVQAQDFYKIVFPPDYKVLLSADLPITNQFYD